jgi:hypothetical protein
MEKIEIMNFIHFCNNVMDARGIKGLPNIPLYDLRHYCNTLINGASIFQLIASMGCSDRLDLVDSDEQGSNTSCDELAKKFQQFTKSYLGLELTVDGDPRGAVFKLVVDPSIGDSFGDRTHLCVPHVDAYLSLC